MLKNLLRFKNADKFLNQARPLLRNPEIFNCRWFAIEDNRDYAQATANETAENSENKPKILNPFATKNVPTSELGKLSDKGSSSEPLTAAEREQRLKVLQLEADIAFQEGRRVPSSEFFQAEHWDQLLTLPSKSARIKYYAFLWQIEMKKAGKERKKFERAENVLLQKERLRQEREENTHIIYGLGHTSLFLRIYDSTIIHWMNHRLTTAMQFSPKIVLDCSYDNHMTRREARYAAKQLMLSFAENRAHDDPFDLHYCNVDMNSPCMHSLNGFIPTMMEPEFPMNVHKQCFTELFPKENLVYLTPHCRTDLQAYNQDDVYIIGAMVDKMNNEPLSLAKAKRLGLRMARLPLDQYLQWGSGSGKSLTINQMVNILLDLRKTGDWEKALLHVPRRKIVNMEMEEYRQRNALKQRANKLNVRIDKLMDFETGDDERKVRSHKQNLEFNLDTWASKKKNRNSQ